MEIITDISSLRSFLKNKASIAFVPTMGNLHEGHLSLVQMAKQQAECTVVSIFVNHLQFSPTEDFNQYPRTLEKDCTLLKDNDVTVVFTPSERTLYPEAQKVLLNLPPVANTLEGEYRPGFFQGVATVVLKLFNIVQPQVAIFGKKDYQQFYIVQEMARQLNFPIDILAGETIRAADGLALSSRNGYLNNDERIEASRLYKMLLLIKQAIEQGNKNFQKLQDNAKRILTQSGWKVDYIALQQRNTLNQATVEDHELVVLGAAWLNKTRLIDNLEIHD
ncbi:MAG: pantoate--beta-alanine ligase [Nitrosomonas sp.]|nr:pantoate--beta-alanine ligase [Nitrosomonas sp.]MDP1951718.1 pantoate--beta-alanine ligase [Nitrosomonas sp.]